MKTAFYTLLIVLISACGLQTPLDSKYIDEIKAFQEEMNSEFKNPETSPLTEVDIQNFDKLDFYPIDKKYRVSAFFEINPKQEEIEIKTSTDRLPVYKKYGIAHFTIDGINLKINIYQNTELSKREEYKDHLFMLFTDNSSGKGSYGGGRYIDLKIPGGDTLIIDFNKSYNPYCTYNKKYSCPIPPEEDHFDLEIKAGIKDYH